MLMIKWNDAIVDNNDHVGICSFAKSLASVHFHTDAAVVVIPHQYTDCPAHTLTSTFTFTPLAFSTNTEVIQGTYVAAAVADSFTQLHILRPLFYWAILQMI